MSENVPKLFLGHLLVVLMLFQHPNNIAEQNSVRKNVFEDLTNPNGSKDSQGKSRDDRAEAIFVYFDKKKQFCSAQWEDTRAKPVIFGM